jgi:CheY-like chemotaxis protein
VKQAIHILLIEDDNDDAELLEDALAENTASYSLSVLNDGAKLMEHLNNSAALPDVIVLDYNLPKIHGRDLLKQIKETSSYERIPVVILTTSSSAQDIDYAYQHKADRFLIKPSTVPGIREMVQIIIALAGQ